MDILKIVILILSVVLTAYAIVKRYSPAVALLSGGIIMMACSFFINQNWNGVTASVTNFRPTGFFIIDLFSVITKCFESTFSGLGMFILTIGGFAYFVDKIGSANTLVYYAMKFLRRIKNPYVVLLFTFYFGVFLNIFIDSAAGLGLLLAATVYPVLRRLGISRLAAASVISTTGSFAISPLSSLAAFNSTLLNIPIHEYFFHYKVVTSVFIVIIAGLFHFFWHRHCDGKIQPERGNNELNDISHIDLKPDHPVLAAIPVIPILIMLIAIFNKSVKLDISTVMFISVFIAVVINFFIKRNSLKDVFNLINEYLSGMSPVVGVIILLVAGQIFASGLISLSAVDYLVKAGNSLNLGGTGVSLIFSAISFCMAALIGSGNAAVIAFGNISPELAHQFSVPLMTFLMPLHDISILGRPIAPIAGVIIAVAGIAKLNVIDLAKRNIVPMAGTAVFAFISNLIFITYVLK
ncbi:TPA: C4-dicarboxylate transporter DcuC [Salmonella enterica subsp. enterica serovar Montevideo]|nr:C4-dicarboxylate transporter DcuC [Salmonella enterica]HDC2563277.1 C4-dicarboxylate transporter DcuC [Salmonella enterica]